MRKFSNYEKNQRKKRRKIRPRSIDQSKKSHDVLISTHGCNWAADNLSHLLAKNGMNVAVVRKPRRCDLKIMVGWYVNNHSEGNHQQEMLLAKKRVVWWVGTDILWLEGKKTTADHPSIKWLNNNHIEHWAEWEHSKKRLEKCGLKNVRVVHMPTRRRYRPLPLPEVFTAGVYCYDSRQAFYGIDVVKRAARILPDVKWLIYPRYKSMKHGNIEYLAKVKDGDMAEKIYARQSVHVRIVASDGMPQGPMEAMMCGRPVIYNFQPLRHAVQLSNAKPENLARAVDFFRKEQAKGWGYNSEGSLYWHYLNNPLLLVREIERVLGDGQES